MKLYIFRCRTRQKMYGATQYETASNLPTDQCSSGWEFFQRVDLSPRGTLRFSVDTPTLRRAIQRQGYYIWDDAGRKLADVAPDKDAGSRRSTPPAETGPRLYVERERPPMPDPPMDLVLELAQRRGQHSSPPQTWNSDVTARPAPPALDVINAPFEEAAPSAAPSAAPTPSTVAEPAASARERTVAPAIEPGRERQAQTAAAVDPPQPAATSLTSTAEEAPRAVAPESRKKTAAREDEVFTSPDGGGPAEDIPAPAAKPEPAERISAPTAKPEPAERISAPTAKPEPAERNSSPTAKPVSVRVHSDPGVSPDNDEPTAPPIVPKVASQVNGAPARRAERDARPEPPQATTPDPFVNEANSARSADSLPPAAPPIPRPAPPVDDAPTRRPGRGARPEPPPSTAATDPHVDEENETPRHVTRATSPADETAVEQAPPSQAPQRFVRPAFEPPPEPVTLASVMDRSMARERSASLEPALTSEIPQAEKPARERSAPLEPPLTSEIPQAEKPARERSAPLEPPLTSEIPQAEKPADPPKAAGPARHHVVWFDIPVRDMDRALRFYSSVLGVPLKKEQAGPGAAVALLPHADGFTGGCLVQNMDAKPSDSGPLLYLNTQGRLDEALNVVEKYGGKILAGRHSIDPFGFRAVVLDSEGNRVALHSM
ncbi:MAG TPA: VOC family protein [Terriglobia bacterium]|nr:VOC family protein [Terriglobia bacterium]